MSSNGFRKIEHLNSSLFNLDKDLRLDVYFHVPINHG
jgi:hypothetical protein